MRYAFLYDGIETFVEVTGESKRSQSVQISAFTGGFDDEIALYNGTFCGDGVMVRHLLAVRKLEELHLLLKLDGSVYRWTSKAGLGVLVEPRGSIPGFDQFVMGVSYRTRGKTASAWNWSCIGDDIRVTET
ncbi:hypothetical protein QOZ80_1BG0072530 [Eleusine coracana subsp. coracana]|nr:hypothetical protein QOZ80_1BG0072530 [Eleusine coracana subsp. coracana]